MPSFLQRENAKNLTSSKGVPPALANKDSWKRASRVASDISETTGAAVGIDLDADLPLCLIFFVTFMFCFKSGGTSVGDSDRYAVLSASSIE